MFDATAPLGAVASLSKKAPAECIAPGWRGSFSGVGYTVTGWFSARPARIALDEKNDWSAPGARASAAMNFRDADRTPELELNEIIWQSVRGAGSVMPPPRRTGFVRSIDEDDER